MFKLNKNTSLIAAAFVTIMISSAPALSNEVLYDADGWSVIKLDKTERFAERCALRKVGADGQWTHQFVNMPGNDASATADNSSAVLITVRLQLETAPSETGKLPIKMEIDPGYTQDFDGSWRLREGALSLYSIRQNDGFDSILNPLARGFKLSIVPDNNRFPPVALSLDGSFKATTVLRECLASTNEA